MDKHNDGAGARFETLEERLAEFIIKLDQMNEEMTSIKKQQQDLLEIIKQTLK